MELVHLSIRVKQKYPEQEPDFIKQNVDGILKRVSDHWVITYKEQTEGMEGVRSTLHLLETGVVLERSGSISSRMVFEKGKTSEFQYGLDVGTIDMEIQTLECRWAVSDKDAKIDIRYRIGYSGGEFGEIDYHLVMTK